MAPPLVYERYGRYDGHNRKAGAMAGKKAMRSRLVRRSIHRQLAEQVDRLELWGFPRWIFR